MAETDENFIRNEHHTTLTKDTAQKVGKTQRTIQNEIKMVMGEVGVSSYERSCQSKQTDDCSKGTRSRLTRYGF